MKKLSLIIIVLIFSSCSSDKIHVLPDGNIDKGISQNSDSVNTEGNETGPTKRPGDIGFYSYPYTREFTDHSDPNEDIMSSKDILLEGLALKYSDRQALEDLTSDKFSLNFTTNEIAYTAFIHPPTEDYANLKNVPIRGAKGGTDLYEVTIKNNTPEFKALEELNSIFWESHPFAVDTIHNDVKVTLLIWSSTRESGYRYAVDLEGNKQQLGNMELYYAFKKDGVWGEVKKMPDEINLPGANEGTPFLYCMCYNPTLFFSSDRGNNESDLVYDIYSANITIDIENEIIDIAQGAGVNRLEKGKGQINTDADDRYPFIPNPIFNPDSRYLYLSSNRNEEPVDIGKDTVMHSKGGYDIYKFELPSQFDCNPPPPPKLYMVTHLNEINIKTVNDSIVADTTYDVTTNLLVNGNKVKTKKVFEVDLSKQYRLSKNTNDSDCLERYCVGISVTTPQYILKDDTIHVEMECFTTDKPDRVVEFSTSEGIAFFVTGYWWPLTNENYANFLKKSRANELKYSRFIDSTDYDYYKKAADMNQSWFDMFYSNIDSVLKEMDLCADNQRLVISTHGFTDPIRLRPTPENRFTKYTSDGDFRFSDFMFLEGTDMKNPELVTSEGKPINWKLNSQQGNRSLSLLRSYFTRRTIERDLKERYQGDPVMMERYEKFVSYNMDYFGIYNRKIDGNYVKSGKCPQLDNKIFNPENLPASPSVEERNNFPFSRRVMVYADVVSKNDVVQNKFQRNRCGDIKGEIEKLEPQETDSTARMIAEKVVEKRKEETKKIPEASSCAGPCYRVLFAKSINKDEADYYRNILETLGFKGVKVSFSNSFFTVVSETFDNEKSAVELLGEYQLLMNKKLKGLFNDLSTRAQVVMVSSR